MTLIYRTDRTRVPVTQRGVSRNEGEGWGSHLALFKTQGYISARSSEVRYAEEVRPMIPNMRRNRCQNRRSVRSNNFSGTSRVSRGVNAVTVWAVGKNRYQLNMLI